MQETLNQFISLKLGLIKIEIKSSKLVFIDLENKIMTGINYHV